MRFPFPLPRFAGGVCLAFGALALLAAHPVQAQGTLSTRPDPVVAVRLGAYFPFNNGTQRQTGKTYAGGGIDYAFQHQPTSRSIVSLDYIARSSGGSDVRLIPLTVGQFTILPSQNSVTPYAGFGVGAYFVHSKLTDDAGIQQTSNGTAFGGYIAGGLDFGSQFFLEARYHALTKIGSAKLDGLQVTAGVRF